MGCVQSSATLSPTAPVVSSPKAELTGTPTKNEVTERGTSAARGSGARISNHQRHPKQKQLQHKHFKFLDRPPKRDELKRNEIGKHLLKEKKRDFRNYYNIVRQIGKGSISTIYLVRKKKQEEAQLSEESTNGTEQSDVYALKEIDISLLNPETELVMRNEIQLMQVLDHPNIERIFEVYQHPTTGYLSIIMDYLSGGDLNARVPYTEDQARSVVWSVCEALNYMHTPSPEVIIHRDIKFGNIMFESTAEDAQVKLIDFGLSMKYGKKKLTSFVGTVYTMAPEVIRDEGYCTKADMWSVGVVTYELLAGSPPFWVEKGTLRDITKLIVKGAYNFKGPNWQSISADAKSFISKLLEQAPMMRMSAQKALQHPWLKPLAFQKEADIDYDFLAKCYNNAEEYASSSDFHKLALQAVARTISTDDVVNLRRAFHTLDETNTGQISYRDMLDVLGARYPARKIKELFAQIDVDNNGKLHYTEFLAATMGVRGQITEGSIQEAFDVFDADDSGYISRDDLRQLLGKDATEAYIDQLLEEADKDRNGTISFEDFKSLFRDKHKEQTLKVIQCD